MDMAAATIAVSRLASALTPSWSSASRRRRRRSRPPIAAPSRNPGSWAASCVQPRAGFATAVDSAGRGQDRLDAAQRAEGRIGLTRRSVQRLIRIGARAAPLALAAVLAGPLLGAGGVAHAQGTNSMAVTLSLVPDAVSAGAGAATITVTRRSVSESSRTPQRLDPSEGVDRMMVRHFASSSRV